MVRGAAFVGGQLTSQRPRLIRSRLGGQRRSCHGACSALAIAAVAQPAEEEDGHRENGDQQHHGSDGGWGGEKVESPLATGQSKVDGVFSRLRARRRPTANGGWFPRRPRSSIWMLTPSSCPASWRGGRNCGAGPARSVAASGGSSPRPATRRPPPASIPRSPPPGRCGSVPPSSLPRPTRACHATSRRVSSPLRPALRPG